MTSKKFHAWIALVVLAASAHAASTQPASTQPASIQPASIQPASIQPASIQPASIQPASEEAAQLRQWRRFAARQAALAQASASPSPTPSIDPWTRPQGAGSASEGRRVFLHGAASPIDCPRASGLHGRAHRPCRAGAGSAR